MFQQVEKMQKTLKKQEPGRVPNCKQKHYRVQHIFKLKAVHLYLQAFKTIREVDTLEFCFQESKLSQSLSPLCNKIPPWANLLSMKLVFSVPIGLSTTLSHPTYQFNACKL